MKYENYICPVCKEQFTEDSDVVVCPECGTPHHRSCWKQNGRCANEDKHGAQETIEVEYVQVEDAPSQEEASTQTEAKPLDDAQAIEEMRETLQRVGQGDMSGFLLNGNHSSLYEAAIGKNQKYYIPRFMLIDKTKKAISWNLFAFLVPMAWTLYRKMYRFTALIMAIYMLFFGMTAYFFASDEDFVRCSEICLQEDPEYVTKILMYNSQNYEGTLTPNQQELIKVMNEVKIPQAFLVIKYIVNLAIKIVMGIFGTYLYFKKLNKSVEKHLKLPLTQKQRMSLLFRRNGTFPIIICAIIGFIEWQMF